MDIFEFLENITYGNNGSDINFFDPSFYVIKQT